jgi:hypothetical protein
MERTFLNLEMSTGRFFEYSKEEKPGFELHEQVNKQNNTTKKTFRRYLRDGAFGYLRSLHTHEKTMGKDGPKVTHVRIVLADDQENLTIAEFPMKDQKGQLNSFSVSLFQYAKTLVEGRCYNFFPYAIEDEKTKRKNYGLTVRLARLEPLTYDKTNKLPKTTISYYKKDEQGNSVLVKGDIPAAEWQMGLDDKPVMVTTNRDIALWNLFKECRIAPDFKISANNGGAGTFDSSKEGIAEKPVGSAPVEAKPKATAPKAAPTAAPTATPTATLPKVEHTVAGVDEEDDEDLPF